MNCDQYANRRGERNALAKLTPEMVREIRAARAGVGLWRKASDEAATLKALAKRYGVSMATVSQAANGRRWGGEP